MQLDTNKIQKKFAGIKDILLPIIKENDVSFLGVFGSFARGEETQGSDVDLVVDFEKKKSFFDLARIQEKLEEVLKREVDLVFKDYIKPALKPLIEKDLIILYEKR